MQAVFTKPSADLVAQVRAIVANYPHHIATWMSGHAHRIAHDYRLVTERIPAGGRICDIGGGYSPFGMLCAANGFDVMVVDDFQDPWHRAEFAVMQPIFRRYGVILLQEDIRTSELFTSQRFHAVTLFHVLEHFHTSPQPLLHSVLGALKAGGTLVIATPNCVNLRKRLTVPFGVGKWSSFESWYGEPTFRGHVREPDVDDLQRIAADLGLHDVTILGRNFFGMQSHYPMVKQLARVADPVLRWVPSLCSDIYMMGTRGRRLEE